MLPDFDSKGFSAKSISIITSSSSMLSLNFLQITRLRNIDFLISFSIYFSKYVLKDMISVQSAACYSLYEICCIQFHQLYLDNLERQYFIISFDEYHKYRRYASH